MFVSRKRLIIRIGLVLVLACLWLIPSRSRWLRAHGRVTCEGQPVRGATLYRSVQGDVFLDWPNNNEGMPAVSVQDHILLRCNSPAFTHVFGMLVSREAMASSQCTTMWKGAGSGDVIPPHTVTPTYAEFPWGSCRNLRLEY